MSKPAHGDDGMNERVERTLEERAARAASVASSPLDAEEVRAVARFPIGALVAAIDLRSLRAAIPLRRVTPVPLAPPPVIGILRFQGTTLTALSLASLLGLGGMRRDPAVLLVIEIEGGRLLALDAEEIPRADTLRESAIRSAIVHAEGLADVTTEDLRVVRLLDPPIIVRRFDAMLAETAPVARVGAQDPTDGI